MMVSLEQSTPSMPKCYKASRLGRRSRHECGNRPTRLSLPKIRRSIQLSWRLPSRPKTVRRMRKLTRYRLATPSQAASVGESRARVHYVAGANANDNAGDRNYLVLAKPNVIMNDTDSEDWGRLAATPAAGTVCITTRRPPGALDGHSGMQPWVPGSSRPRDWTANRLPSLRLPSPTHPRLCSPTLIRVRT